MFSFDCIVWGVCEVFSRNVIEIVEYMSFRIEGS